MIYTLQAGDGGLVSDVDGMDLTDKFWTDGKNVRFEDGYVTPFNGHYAVYDPPSVVPYGIFNLKTASADLWAYTGLAKAYAVNNGGTHFNITRTTGGDYTATADTKWTGGALTGFLIFNNKNDIPQSWNGDTGTAAANLVNWTSTWRCEAIRPVRNYLVAVGITKTSTAYPKMVKWSHSADPGALPDSWDEANATKDAGEQDIGDANGNLVDVVALGDQGIIYATDSYHAMQYIGGTFVWRFTKLSDQAGALSQNCVAATPNGHVVLTTGDVILHAGGAPQSIITNRMRKHLFGSIDSTNFRRSFVVHDELKNEVWVCIPSSGSTSCNVAYVWNRLQNSWGIRDLPNAAAGNCGPVVAPVALTWADDEGDWTEETGTWESTNLAAVRRRLILASTDTKLHLCDYGQSFNGSRPAMSAEKVGISLGDASRIKLVKSIRPKVDGTVGQSLMVRVGSAMFADGPYTWTAPTTYRIGQDIAAYALASGRFIGIRLESSVGANWRAREFDIEFEFTGQQ